MGALSLLPNTGLSISYDLPHLTPCKPRVSRVIIPTFTGEETIHWKVLSTMRARASVLFTSVPVSLSDRPSGPHYTLSEPYFPFTIFIVAAINPSDNWLFGVSPWNVGSSGARTVFILFTAMSRTPGPQLWMLYKYSPTDSQSWSGHSWDLDPGVSNSPGSRGTQGPG